MKRVARARPRSAGAPARSPAAIALTLSRLTPRERRLALLAGLVLLYVLVVNAWVSDDGYITFRTIDNLVHGYGLTWNVEERVQVYTHPLWMIMVAAFYAVTREPFYTSIVLSLALTLGAILLAAWLATRRGQGEFWKVPLLVLALIASKALIDFSTAGLENALSYLLSALFLAVYLGAPRPRLFPLALLTSLAYLSRPDLVILFGPALVAAVIRLHAAGETTPGRIAKELALGASPAVLWTLFSLVYYGFPFPNTAYAKMLATAVPASWKLRRGFEYLGNSLLWDTASHLMVLAAFVLGLRRSGRRLLPLLAGVFLYEIYIVVSAASATHMSGRFYAVPFFLAITLFVLALPGGRPARVSAAVLAAALVLNPVSAIKLATPAYRPPAQRPSSIDARWYSYQEGSALVNWRPGKRMPAHPWLDYGERVRAAPGKVHIGGAFELPAIGFAGYGAGPEKFLIDKVGLSDPLLARLPARRPAAMSGWKSGHFAREIPAGYPESVSAGVNAIADPELRLYYDKIRLITRAPLFAKGRLAAIVGMNLGRYDFLLAKARAAAARPAKGEESK